MRSPDLSELQAFRERLCDLEDDVLANPIIPLQKVKHFNPRRALVWTFLLLIFTGWARGSPSPGVPAPAPCSTTSLWPPPPRA